MRRPVPVLVLAVLAAVLAGCSTTTGGSGVPGSSAPAASSSSASSSSTPTPTTTAPSTPTGSPVHISLLESDGGSFGVGMPIVAWFSVAPTDATELVKDTVVKVNGTPVQGAWYFEPTAHQGSALEGHYRTQNYWPPNATIHMDLPLKGKSAGAGLYFDDSLTLDIATGDARIGTVDATTLQLSITDNGQPWGTFPVSLGAPETPTARGIKVIMEKGLDISMQGPGYFDPHVKFTQRLTYGGEYLHSAPWNIANLGKRSTSNGCTNLAPADAQRLYDFLQIGDPIQYPNATGPQMTLGAGYGDWNLQWSQWLTGGALATQH